MGLMPTKLTFDVEDWTLKATVHYGTTPPRGDDPTVLLNLRIFLDDQEVTDNFDLADTIAFEHRALEYAYEQRDNQKTHSC